jgi:hypothetical protein
MCHPLSWVPLANCYHDKLILVYFGPIALLCFNMATLGQKGHAPQFYQAFTWLLIHGVEAKPQVSFDWLATSSKLQPYLNCTGSSKHFLRQDLQDGKRISSSALVKRLMCSIHQNGWRITRGTQSERRVLRFETRRYNKSHPIPKSYCFSKIVDKSLSLFVSDPCLTSLNSACISFTPN